METVTPVAETASPIAEPASVASGGSLAPGQNGSDAVGFGKHGELTYDEIWAKDPRYCQWAINKFKELVAEGVELDTPYQDGDSKMKRLVHWLVEKDKQAEMNGPRYEHDKNGELVEVPSSLSLKERADAALAEKAPKFYGIAAPEKRVCTTWEECKKYVHGVKGVMYRSFPTREEAEAYVQNPPARKVRTATKNPPEAKKDDDDADASAPVDGTGVPASENAPALKKKGKGTRRKKDQAEANTDEAEKVPAKKKRKVSTPSEATDGTPGAAPANEEPKKPMTAYLLYTQANRDAVQKELGVKEFGPVSKTLSARWKTLSAADRQVYEKEAEDAKAQYAKDLAAFEEAGGVKAKAKAKGKAKAKAKAKVKAKAKAKALVAKAKKMVKATIKAKAKAKESGAAAKQSAQFAVEEDKETHAPTSSADVTSKPSKATKANSAKSQKEASDPVADISEEVMQQAESLGLAANLRNLAARAEIVRAGLPGDKLLKALQACDGLVNKAKASLLESEVSTPSKEASQPEATIESDTPEKEYKSQVDSPPCTSEGDKPKTTMTDEQRERIRKNRERALAKKQQMQEKSGGA